MFCLVLQIIFSHPAVIFLKLPLISDHLTSTIPTSAVSKINVLHTNATKHWGRGYLLNQPPVWIATSLTQSFVFVQLENMPRLLRKQTDILICFHDLFCLLVNDVVCIISQLSSPLQENPYNYIRRSKKTLSQWILGNYTWSQMFTWQKASIYFTLIAQYLCQMKMWPTFWGKLQKFSNVEYNM